MPAVDNSQPTTKRVRYECAPKPDPSTRVTPNWWGSGTSSFDSQQVPRRYIIARPRTRYCELEPELVEGAAWIRACAAPVSGAGAVAAWTILKAISATAMSR